MWGERVRAGLHGECVPLLRGDGGGDGQDGPHDRQEDLLILQWLQDIHQVQVPGVRGPRQEDLRGASQTDRAARSDYKYRPDQDNLLK